MNATYPCNLTDAEWACVQPHLPANVTRRRWPRHSIRRVLDAIFYLLRTGCPWRYLPCDYPPWQTVYHHFRRFRQTGVWHQLLVALRAVTRERDDRDPQPSAAIIDAQSVKTVEESAGSSGFDGHMRAKGRKRHLLVDTLGLPLSIWVTPASSHDKVGAGCVLVGLKPLVPRLVKIWADGAYTSGPLTRWCAQYGGWNLEIVGRDPDVPGFAIQPRRWVVERSFAWLVRNRRLRLDDERRVQTSETLMRIGVHPPCGTSRGAPDESPNTLFDRVL